MRYNVRVRDATFKDIEVEAKTAEREAKRREKLANTIRAAYCRYVSNSDTKLTLSEYLADAIIKEEGK